MKSFGTSFCLHRTVLSEEHRHACSLVALDKERHTEHVADTWCKIMCITLWALNAVFTRTAFLNPCPAIIPHFTEAQLYTNGSAFKDSKLGYRLPEGQRANQDDGCGRWY